MSGSKRLTDTGIARNVTWTETLLRNEAWTLRQIAREERDRAAQLVKHAEQMERDAEVFEHQLQGAA